METCRVQMREKYGRATYLLQDDCPECIENPYNSATKHPSKLIHMRAKAFHRHFVKEDIQISIGKNVQHKEPLWKYKLKPQGVITVHVPEW